MAKSIKINRYSFKKLKNDAVLKVLNDVAQQLKVKVYLVGGTVRDLFIKRNAPERIEWDFAVDRGAFKLGKILAKNLNASYIMLDKKNKTARLIYTKNKYHYQLDFTDFRARTLKEDLRRRDFSINALCCNVQRLIDTKESSNVLIDHFKAARDIKAKRIRTVRRQNFKDDPLRILRGFAFCAQFGFKFEPKTLSLIKKNVDALKTVSAERICEEMVKIFSASSSYKQAMLMDRYRILDIIFPEILTLRGVDQGLYHHLDVWGHSLESLAQLERLLRDLPRKIPAVYVHKIHAYLKQEVASNRSRLWLLKLACLFHDIGKPKTRFAADDGKIHFYTHEKVGAQMIAHIGRRLKLSRKEMNMLKMMVLYHLRAGQLVNRMPTEKAKFRFFRDTQDDAGSILLLTIADRWAMRGVLSKKKSFIFLEKEIFNMIIAFFKGEEKAQKAPRLLNGNDLQLLLKIPPGPLVGKILDEIDEAQGLKDIKTKNEAKELALHVFKQKCTLLPA